MRALTAEVGLRSFHPVEAETVGAECRVKGEGRWGGGGAGGNLVRQSKVFGKYFREKEVQSPLSTPRQVILRVTLSAYTTQGVGALSFGD